MIRAGLALLTEDRKADGLFVNFDTPRNITIANLGSIVRERPARPRRASTRLSQ